MFKACIVFFLYFCVTVTASADMTCSSILIQTKRQSLIKKVQEFSPAILAEELVKDSSSLYLALKREHEYSRGRSELDADLREQVTLFFKDRKRSGIFILPDDIKLMYENHIHLLYIQASKALMREIAQPFLDEVGNKYLPFVQELVLTFFGKRLDLASTESKEVEAFLREKPWEEFSWGKLPEVLVLFDELRAEFNLGVQSKSWEELELLAAKELRDISFEELRLRFTATLLSRNLVRPEEEFKEELRVEVLTGLEHHFIQEKSKERLRERGLDYEQIERLFKALKSLKQNKSVCCKSGVGCRVCPLNRAFLK